MGAVRRRNQRAATCFAVAVVAIGGALVGCGSAGIGDVEKKIAEELPKEAKKNGADIALKGDVKCPDNASVKKGSTFNCTVDATQSGADVALTISVKMTADDKFEYGLEKVEPVAGGVAKTTTTN
jgi:Domain of unknown function (DUF4333)